MTFNLNLRLSISLIILFAFLSNTVGPIPMAQAQAGPAIGGEFILPKPGGMIYLSPQFNPPILKGLKVHPDNPFRFDFILDKGDRQLGNDRLKEESTKLIKYFLASLTIPEKDLWVNLSPYEKDRVISQSFGLTEMGRDLLAEDYMLKQITASLIYPEDEIGKKFWKRIYEEAAQKFGTTNIPVNSFNKVWIMPEKAVVYENAKAATAYVVESRLKVMLEEDYLSMQKHANVGVTEGGKTRDSSLASNILRAIVIPELTKEVNEGKNFSQLRQVYNSLILAIWYKKKIKDSILEQVYADKNKIAGVDYQGSYDVAGIYQRYLQAFKKGVYSYIKEDYDPATHQTMPKKYFSGGVTFLDPAMVTFTSKAPQEMPSDRNKMVITANLQGYGTNRAMLSGMKIFLDPNTTQRMENVLRAKVVSLIRSKKTIFSTEKVDKFVKRAVRVMQREGYSSAYMESIIKNSLETQSKGDNTFLDPGTEPLWQEAVKQSRGLIVVPSSRPAFVRRITGWIKERHGVSVDETKIKLNTDRTNTANIATVYDTVILQLNKGISYLDAYHEMLHLIGNGFVAFWIDEAVTEKLTKDLFDDLGEKVIGEKMIYHYKTYQRWLNRVADVIGWEPFMVSYMTGDESFVVEALGENGQEAFSLIESMDMFPDVADRLINIILNNLHSRERLRALAQFLIEQKSLEKQGKRNWEVFNEKFELTFPEFAAGLNKIERFKISTETYGKLTALSQDAGHPALRKNAQVMLAKSDRAMSSASGLMVDAIESVRSSADRIRDVATANEFTWKMLEKEGYSLQELPPGGTSNRQDLEFLLSKNGVLNSNGSIKLQVFPQQKVIWIMSFYPNFPYEKVGRGRALLKQILESKKFQGYHILASAKEGFRKSLQKIGYQMEASEAPLKLESRKEFLDMLGSKSFEGLDQQSQHLLRLFIELSNIHGIVSDKAMIGNSNLNHNVKMIFSDEFNEVLYTESVGGNAGEEHAAVNGVMDAEGRIIAFGNSQDLKLRIPGWDKKLSNGTLYEFTIRTKMFGFEDGTNSPHYELYLSGHNQRKIGPEAVNNIEMAVKEADRISKEQRVQAEAVKQRSNIPAAVVDVLKKFTDNEVRLIVAMGQILNGDRRLALQTLESSNVPTLTVGQVKEYLRQRSSYELARIEYRRSLNKNSLQGNLFYQARTGLMRSVSEDIKMQYFGNNEVSAINTLKSNRAKQAFKAINDSAMLNRGGIDLTFANMSLRTQNAGEGIKFKLGPAMLQQLQNAPGFVPVIISIQPMTDLKLFLGLADNQSATQKLPLGTTKNG